MGHIAMQYRLFQTVKRVILQCDVAAVLKWAGGDGALVAYLQLMVAGRVRIYARLPPPVAADVFCMVLL